MSLCCCSVNAFSICNTPRLENYDYHTTNLDKVHELKKITQELSNSDKQNAVMNCAYLRSLP